MFRLIVSQPLCESEIALWTTSEERTQACGFAPARCAEWLSWRALVRRELRGMTGCDPRRIAIGYDAVGAPRVEIRTQPTENPHFGAGISSLAAEQPFVAGGAKLAIVEAESAADRAMLFRNRRDAGGNIRAARPSFFLAVSHCEGSIAVALADAPCAVDVESLDRDFGRVAPRYMTCDERALSDDARWPAIVWCAKETLYKFAGRRELNLLRDLRIESVDSATATLVGRICGSESVTLRFLVFAGRAIVYSA